MKKSLFFAAVLVLFTSSLLPAREKTVVANYTQAIRPVKDLMAVNKLPFPQRTSGYVDAGITMIRMHDLHGANDYCFYTNFWNFDASTQSFTTRNPAFDPVNPASYTWGDFDASVNKILGLGMEPYIRLGTSYPGPVSIKQPDAPPLDDDGVHFTKFAELCRRTVMHINGGWDNGTYHHVRYWEIWCEPDGIFWSGTPLQFFQMYKAVSTAMKSYDPSLKVGGPGVTPATTIGVKTAYLDPFLDYMAANNAPLDFYSWHLYGIKNPYGLKTLAENIRAKLNAAGFINAESHVTEINTPLGDALAQLVDTPEGATFYLSLLITAQESPIDRFFWYPGNAFFNDDPNGPNYTWGGYALKIYSTIMRETPIQIETDGEEVVAGDWDTEATNFQVMAAKSPDGNRVYLTVSNYRSDIDHLEITLNNLPWTNGNTLLLRKNIIKGPDEKFTETDSILKGAPALQLSVDHIAAPAVVFIRLEKQN